MKKLAQNESKIVIQSAVDSGTSFYKVTLDDAIDMLNSENIILTHQLYVRGWNALDLEHFMFGSIVEDDILYICDTDGREIEVDGKLVEPEFALDEYGVDALSSYIKPATPEIVKRYISTYELGPVNLDKAAYALLQEGYSFKDIVDAADDAGLIEL